ncbi:uncharacterized protein TTMY_0105 [Thermus thermophilus]|uniref:hypothetical protein n=1 Tax=Thermus thermophilus TaxID=274 RepID=UPI00090ACB65|nr:hypothetical protein [Thermus thermophilus]BAW00519.1 uncharacterized protein TTMY_0105 [Thermus thermophilus]BDB11239.1 hypothetical protein TthTMY_09780 [Thermus thermophilus]
MKWELYRWVWRLRSPLHLGTAPAGSLNRTRLYVPAYTLRGALINALAGKLGVGPSAYQKATQALDSRFRLTYLFPAEREGDKWFAWLPRYKEGQGLVWQREGREDSIPDRRFRMKLLSTRTSTAIDPGSDTASDGTLREVEVIHPWFAGEEPREVFLVGYVLYLPDSSKGSASPGGLEAQANREATPVEEEAKKYLLEEKGLEVFVGGELRYGLGRIELVHRSQEAKASLWDVQVDPNQNDPVVDRPGLLLAHGFAGGDQGEFKGSRECVAVWDNAPGRGGLKSRGLAWTPGTIPPELRWRIREDGFWEPA